MRQNVFRSAWMIAAAAMVVTGAFCGQAYAVNEIVAQWNFEINTPSDLTAASGPLVAAEFGTGSMQGVHASALSDWTTPAGNGSANSYSVTNWAVGDYYQFQTSTTGLSNIGLQFDHVSSTTGPRDFTLQYSTNGTSFTNFANYSVQPNANPAWSSAGAVAPLGLDTFDFNLTSITALNNAANVYFRLLAATPLVAAQQGSTPAATGTNRLDNVSIMSSYDPTQSPVIQPVAAPVLPATGDIVVGLGSGRQKTTLELVRGSVVADGGAKPAPYSSWTAQNFSRLVKFDNLGGSNSHNAHGNLLAVDGGATAAAGGNIYSYATQGSVPSPAPQLLATTNTASGAATRLGGLSVSPDNTKIAVVGMDTGKVLVYDYTAGNSLGAGASVSGLRQSSAIVDTYANAALFGSGVVSQEGSAWLNNNTVLAFSASGNLYTVDATSMASTLAKTVTTNAVAQSSTALAYNPNISPYIYAIYSGFQTGTNRNTLFIFDPAAAYNDLTAGGIDFSTSAQTIRDIALDASGNLFLVTNSPTTTDPTGRLEYIPDVKTTLGSTTPNSSVNWYNDEVFQSQPGFAGLDIGLAPPGVSGDYNSDGKVNAQDYVIWRKTNINGPAGYTAWRSNYGTGVAGSGSGLDGASVPEPASIVLVLVGLAGFGLRRRSA